MPRILVIGGANMDLAGRCERPPVAGDSNPGQVTMSMGGVGRNIAHNLALLGAEVSLLTALGDDEMGRMLWASCEAAGMDLSLCVTVKGGRTGTYLALLDNTGDMTMAVNDMAVLDALTPEALSPRLTEIRRYDALVVDANVPEETLRWLGENVETPIVADPVSCHKCQRLRGLLPYLTAIKPNRMEAEALSGVSITDESSLRRSADALLDAGVENVFISLSTKGIFAKNRRGEEVRLPCPAVTVANATGGGDAMAAAITWELLRGAALRDTARFAMGAGALACTAATTIHPGMSRENVLSILRDYGKEVF